MRLCMCLYTVCACESERNRACPHEISECAGNLGQLLLLHSSCNCTPESEAT